MDSAVSIFHHTGILTPSQQFSLEVCCTLLKEYPIYLFFPDQCDLGNFQPWANQIEVVRIKPQFFRSIHHYNQFKLSPNWLEQVKPAKYALTYELDALVFTSDLCAWAAKGYSYIGAPWYLPEHNRAQYMGIGNSGLSLRHVNTHLEIARNLSHWHHMVSRFGFKGLKLYLSYRYFLGLYPTASRKTPLNEDRFLCDELHPLWGISHPSIETAMQFSIETFAPGFDYGIHQWPFGCHAWEKYNRPYWTQKMHQLPLHAELLTKYKLI